MIDSNNSRIEVFDLAGDYLSQWGSQGTEDGQFRFVDLETGQQGPEGDLALDASGNLYVVDNMNHRVQRFSPSGAYLGQWGSEGSGEGQFLYPCGIAVGADGTVYVSDNSQPRNMTGNVSRLQAFDASGGFLSAIAQQPRPGGPVQMLGVAADAMGLVYVAQGESIAVYRP